MKRILLISACTVAGYLANAQLVIQSGAVLHIESGAKVTLQGDLTSSANIQGAGTVQMKGTAAQKISMNGFTVPNLEIDNTANVSLDNSGVRIGTNLFFTNGKLLTGSQDLVIAPSATISNAAASRFIWTSGTGQVKKELTADITNFEIPVGENNNYRPTYLTSTGGTYNSAVVGVRNASGSSSNKPPMIANYVSSVWPVTKSGISNGIQTLSGQYVDGTDVNGTESLLSGYVFDGTNWSSASASQNNTTNLVTAPITNITAGELTGMNKFIAVGARALLQGAYTNPATAGLMNDGLRSGTNVIPVSDPYRTSPYSTSFTHVNNAAAEMASASVFAKQANDADDIVDWVFLELRNTASPGNAVLQTRSAFIQRDGDIVDVDGVSPVTFNNVTNGGYTIAVRHRNHLGLSTAPASPRTLSETRSIAFTTNVADLRIGSTVLFGNSGDAYTVASHPSLTTVNVMWGGNINANINSRYQGPSNDRAILLTDIGSELAAPTGYLRSDLNMNKTVRYQGPSNDRSFLLSNVLANIELAVRNQSLPQ